MAKFKFNIEGWHTLDTPQETLYSISTNKDFENTLKQRIEEVLYKSFVDFYSPHEIKITYKEVE